MLTSVRSTCLGSPGHFAWPYRHHTWANITTAGVTNNRRKTSLCSTESDYSRQNQAGVNETSQTWTFYLETRKSYLQTKNSCKSRRMVTFWGFPGSHWTIPLNQINIPTFIVLKPSDSRRIIRASVWRQRSEVNKQKWVRRLLVNGISAIMSRKCNLKEIANHWTLFCNSDHFSVNEITSLLFRLPASRTRSDRNS